MRKETDMKENQIIQTETEAAAASEETEIPSATGDGEPTPAPEDGDGFTDAESGTESGKEKQGDEQNTKNAKRRREAESAKVQKAKEEAILMALKHKNPYTGDEMKDSEDVREYLAMREIEDGGGDPLKDFGKHQKQKAREERAAREDAEALKQGLADQLKEFREQEPTVDVKNLLADEDFRTYADGKLGTKPLLEVYRSYRGFVDKLTGKTKEEKKAAQATANQRASVGPLSSSAKTETGYYTPEQVKQMSREQVREHYEDIRKSMKKWK